MITAEQIFKLCVRFDLTYDFSDINLVLRHKDKIFWSCTREFLNSGYSDIKVVIELFQKHFVKRNK